MRKTGLKSEVIKEKAGVILEELNLEVIEVKTIEKAMKINNCNMTKVAISLGISRNTLYTKIKKYKIEK